MVGIQNRGRNRITTNKLNQLKITQQNNINNQAHLDKIAATSYKEGQTNWPSEQTQLLKHKKPDGSYYQPYYESPVREDPTSTIHGDGSGSATVTEPPPREYDKYIPKEPEKIELHGNERFKRTVNGPGDKLRNDDPMSQVMLGIGNTFQDYGGLVQGGYEDKSILNQSMIKAIEGDWGGAGKLIQDNPYRFAGNLIVEAGSMLVPVGGVLKAAKITKLATTVLQHKTIAPVVASVIKTVEPVTNAADKIIKKVIPEKATTTIYSIRPDNTLPGPWGSPKPNEYYFEKVASKLNSGPDGGSGIAQIRSVEVPNQIAKDYTVESILSVFPKIQTNKNVIKAEKKAFGFKQDPVSGDWVPIKRVSNIIQDAPIYAPPKKMYDPNFIGPLRPGELPLDKFYRTATKQDVPNDIMRSMYNDKNKMIVAEEVKSLSANKANEYFIPKVWQNTEKVIATSGKKIPWITRLLNPQYSNDQVTNALVKINKQQGNPTSLNKPGGQLISPASEIPKPFAMADDILKSGSPNPSFMSPLMWGASTVKTVAQASNINEKGREGRGMYEIKSAIAEQWSNPETRPGEWKDRTKYYYQQPGSPDTPYGDATVAGENWAKSFWDTTPPKDERTWRNERPERFYI